MFSNPLTTMIGIVVMLCPIIGHFIPDVKAICDNITGEAIGLGFIASADGIKSPFKIGSAVKSVLFWIGLGIMAASTVSACSSLTGSKAQIEAVLAAQAAGSYEVTFTKDGQPIYKETWDCTSDGKKLTGCHKR